MTPQQANIFYWSTGQPFHLSVGAVVVDDAGQVLVHHYPAGTAAKTEAYLLMRESLEMGEDPLTTVRRGLAEEFGLKADIAEFVGSIVCSFRHDNNVEVEKTTIYFLCINHHPLPSGRTGEDLETRSHLEWLSPRRLAQLSRAQAKAIGRSDFDESKIIERVAEITKNKA